LLCGTLRGHCNFQSASLRDSEGHRRERTPDHRATIQFRSGGSREAAHARWSTRSSRPDRLTVASPPLHSTCENDLGWPIGGGNWRSNRARNLDRRAAIPAACMPTMHRKRVHAGALRHPVAKTRSCRGAFRLCCHSLGSSIDAAKSAIGNEGRHRQPGNFNRARPVALSRWVPGTLSHRSA